MAYFASLASSHEPVLTFWQSDRKSRLKGNLSGPMKTGAGPGGLRPMEFYMNTFLAVYMYDIDVP